jgi:hypothetical protein
MRTCVQAEKLGNLPENKVSPTKNIVKRKYQKLLKISKGKSPKYSAEY